MTEEERQEPEEQQEPEASEQPEAEEAPADAAAAEETPEAEAAPADEAAAEESPEGEEAAEEAPAEDAPAEAPPPAAEADSEEAEPQTPKQIRKLERSRATGPALPQRSPEERAAERAERRGSKAAARRRHRASRRAKRGEPVLGTPPAERAPGTKMVRRGKVVSDKADKTITVELEVVRRHRVYEKVVRRSPTVRAHDERNEANEGDIVRVIEARPTSRTKRWRLVEVLERAK
jgi:small subunit ribosomal protein S17